MSFLSQRLGLTRFEADEYYAQALEDYEDKKLQDAIDNIGFAITLLPTNSEYHAVRGLFYMEDGQEYDAKANFEEALRLHSAEALANYGMGVVAFRRAEWADAVQWFNRARTVNPTQCEVPYYLALVHHRQQDNVMAKTYMEQALQLMEDVKDKRRTDAKAWIREFEKLIKQQEQGDASDEIPIQSALPMAGGGNGVRVSRQELDASKTAGELEAGDDGDDEPEDADEEKPADDPVTEDKAGDEA
ncbi:MAG: hypothetical protein AAFV33_09300 [Chloroflexota bacterium]